MEGPVFSRTPSRPANIIPAGKAIAAPMMAAQPKPRQFLPLTRLLTFYKTSDDNARLRQCPQWIVSRHRPAPPLKVRFRTPTVEERTFRSRPDAANWGCVAARPRSAPLADSLVSASSAIREPLGARWTPVIVHVMFQPWTATNSSRPGGSEAATGRARREGSGKMLDIVNFMNFAGGCCRFARLEFTACHATSGPE
jgi:hypothetical protein